MIKYPSHLAMCALACAAASAGAAPLTFFGEDRGVFNQAGAATGTLRTNSDAARASFLSNLVGVGTESFESYLDGTPAPLVLTFPGAGTATLSGGGVVDDDPGTGQNATTGTKWWRTGANNNFVIDFGAPVAAFGFYGIDVGDVGAQLTLTLSDGSSVSIDIPHTVEAGGPNSGQNGSVVFFGYINTDQPWTKATFSNIGNLGDDFGFDDMTIGSVQQVVKVPEPSVAFLLAGGLLGLLRSRRSRR